MVPEFLSVFWVLFFYLGLPAGFSTPWSYFRVCVSVVVFLSTGHPLCPPPPLPYYPLPPRRTQTSVGLSSVFSECFRCIFNRVHGLCFCRMFTCDIMRVASSYPTPTASPNDVLGPIDNP